MATAVEIPVQNSAKVPVEVYLRSSEYEPDAEYVDGVIEERPMGEFGHASWQYAIQQWFAQYTKDWNIRVRPELRVQVSERRFRVPDVVVVDKSWPVEQILTHAPIAVFEVLSPEDTMPRMLVKLKDYEQMGILTIMVVNPDTKVVYQYKNGNLGVVTAPVQDLAGSVCSIDWRRVEEFLD